MKSGNLNFLEPSGPVQACNGTDLIFFKKTCCYIKKNREIEYHITNHLVVETDARPELSFKTGRPQSSEIFVGACMTHSGNMNSEQCGQLQERYSK